jgi:hypothetical protein
MKPRALSPLLALILFALIDTCAQALLATHHHTEARESALFASLCWSLLLVWWVSNDRLGRHLPVPYEFNAFIFFTWPVTVPYYLCKTRGPRGLLLAAALFFLLLLPSIAAVVVRITRGF